MKKKTFYTLFFIIFVLQFEVLSQNKQNKYYKPIRFSIDGGAKIPLESTPEFNYNFGAGANFGIVYTLNQTASLEASFKSGFSILYNSSNNNSVNMIPITLGIDFYLYDKDFSPYFGIRPGINFVDNTMEPSVSGEIGISYKKMKLYGAYNYMQAGNMIEFGIGYFFRQRPCGCFPHTK